MPMRLRKRLLAWMLGARERVPGTPGAHAACRTAAKLAVIHGAFRFAEGGTFRAAGGRVCWLRRSAISSVATAFGTYPTYGRVVGIRRLRLVASIEKECILVER